MEVLLMRSIEGTQRKRRMLQEEPQNFETRGILQVRRVNRV